MSTPHDTWAFDHCYRALAYAFRVRTNVPGAGDVLDALLAPFRSPPAEAVPTYTIVPGRRRDHASFVVYLDGEDVQKTENIEQALDFVVWSGNEEAVEQTRDFVSLHAAAASLEGRGILLPAPSNSGKSTLVAALVRSGFSYLTDEFALLDVRNFHIQPFPKALWMAPESIELLSAHGAPIPGHLLRANEFKYFVRPDDIRPAAVETEPCPVRYVIAPDYEDESPTALEPMSRAEAMFLLADQSFNFPLFGARCLDIVREAIRDAECYRLRMGDLGEAVRLVTEVICRDRVAVATG